MPAPRQPSDVIAALLALTGRRRFRDDVRLLNGVVIGATSLAPKAPFDVFLPIAVSDGSYLGSQALEEAFELLKQLRVLQTETPDTAFVRLDERSREYIEREIVPDFSIDERCELERVAKFVRKACGVEEGMS